MKEIIRKVDSLLLKKAAQILENHFGGEVKISSSSFLSAPDRRNALIRITLQATSGSAPKTAIIKQSLSEKPGANDQETFARFARDWAGLALIAQQNSKPSLVPEFYGGNTKYRFIVIEDLGDVHQSLVDALTGVDRTEAEAAIRRYVTSVAMMHGKSHQYVDDYFAIFKKLKPDMLMVHDNLADLISKLSIIFNNINLPLNSNMKDEIENVFKMTQGLGPFTTLIHGDICPDNVFDDAASKQMRIIDFEWSFIANALLDGVYMRMCMPTCWCSMVFPEDVIKTSELIYRHELSSYIPAAKIDKVYIESYVAACAYWMLWNVSSVQDIWEEDCDISDPKYLNLHKNWRPEDNLRRPRVLYRIQAFIEVAKKYDALPHLCSMAEHLLAELTSIWPQTKPLEYYKAFIGQGHSIIDMA